MIRLGLMGVGVVASYGHIPAIQRTPGLMLKSIFEPDSGRMMDARARFNVPEGFTNAEAFFKSGIDAVVVTSPAPAHLDNVLMAQRFGKPVLCEKPLAMNEADSQRMVDAMGSAGLPLYVGFTYRFAPCAMEIKRLVAEGAIGAVRSLRLIYNWDCHGKFDPRESTVSSFRRDGRMIEGGPMVDCGVHQIDLARWWLGQEIVRHHGVGAWVDEHAAPDHMYLHLDHVGGAHTMVEISYSYGHTSRDTRCHFVYELIGTDGLIRYDRQARVFEVVNRDGTQHLPWHEEKNFDGMYAEFLRALQSGTPGNMPTGTDGLLATRIARVATEEAIGRRAGASQ
jgi:predicted dehydrogenase